MQLSIHIIWLFFSLLFAQTDVSDEITLAVRSGKSSEVVKYFDEKVSIKLINQEDVLSRSQAEANLKFFFEKHQVKGFITSHTGTGSSNTAQYITGTLETSNGRFRVSILVKRNLITQFRIENSNE